MSRRGRRGRNPTTIVIGDTDRTLKLSPSQDYIISCPSGVLTLNGKMSVWGGHNVVFQNCNEYVASGGGDWAGNFKNQTGTLWIHDVHFGGAYLTGGIELQDPGAAVVLRDVLFGSHTDGRWHLVQCAKGSGGMTRDVDGRLVASNTFTGPAFAYSGYGLIGNRRAGEGAQESIIGDVGQVAIYGNALSQAQDANHYAVGQGQPSTGG